MTSSSFSRLCSAHVVATLFDTTTVGISRPLLSLTVRGSRPMDACRESQAMAGPTATRHPSKRTVPTRVLYSSKTISGRWSRLVASQPDRGLGSNASLETHLNIGLASEGSEPAFDLGAVRPTPRANNRPLASGHSLCVPKTLSELMT